MEIYRNDQGEITCDRLDSDTSVSDLIQAVLRFCHAHVDCTTCIETCCSGLTVYPDHVFLKNLLSISHLTISDQDLADLPWRIMRFDKVTQKWFLPQNGDGSCKFLSQKGRCLLYETRPLVCRLHVCGTVEPVFKKIKDDIYFAYQSALGLEMARLQNGRRLQAVEDAEIANPVSLVDTYEVRVSDILDWSKVVLKNNK